jgi:hypothetical protein
MLKGNEKSDSISEAAIAFWISIWVFYRVSDSGPGLNFNLNKLG